MSFAPLSMLAFQVSMLSRAHVIFTCYFSIFIYVKGSGTTTDSAHSLSKCPEQLKLGQTEATSWKLDPGSLHG